MYITDRSVRTMDRPQGHALSAPTKVQALSSGLDSNDHGRCAVGPNYSQLSPLRFPGVIYWQDPCETRQFVEMIAWYYRLGIFVLIVRVSIGELSSCPTRPVFLPDPVS
jgi:hypothetical protein